MESLEININNDLDKNANKNCEGEIDSGCCYDNNYIFKHKLKDNGLNEIGDYVGDRNMVRDPEEMKHLAEVCAAFFNYKVKLFFCLKF